MGPPWQSHGYRSVMTTFPGEINIICPGLQRVRSVLASLLHVSVGRNGSCGLCFWLVLDPGQEWSNGECWITAELLSSLSLSPRHPGIRLAHPLLHPHGQGRPG